MTPADEIEYIIKEIDLHKNYGTSTSYKITSFPETHIIKFHTCYTVEIMKDYYQNADVNKRFEEFANEFKNKKITIENRIVERNRSITLRGNTLMALVPIYYEDCVFTSPGVVYIDSNCENCIVEKE